MEVIIKHSIYGSVNGLKATVLDAIVNDSNEVILSLDVAHPEVKNLNLWVNKSEVDVITNTSNQSETIDKVIPLKYSIHPIDAVVYNTENKVKMLMCSQGCGTTPIQRKEALLVQAIMNWYSNIDVPMLTEQLNTLRELEMNFDEDSMNGEACCGIGNMVSDLLIIIEDSKE
jgi:hypothetical protein